MNMLSYVPRFRRTLKRQRIVRINSVKIKRQNPTRFRSDTFGVVTLQGFSDRSDRVDV